MANYCDTSYVVEGNKEELDNLYNTMYKLQNMEKPLVENGFGTTWLGCLIAELGGRFADDLLLVQRRVQLWSHHVAPYARVVLVLSELNVSLYCFHSQCHSL